jgi:hypothetical protein
MSQEAKGLSPLAGGLGVPDAWCTTVVAYGPAEATATGRRINRAVIAAARGMTFLMAYLPRIGPEVTRSSARWFAVSRDAIRVAPVRELAGDRSLALGYE